MPAKTVKQQQFFGIVEAIKKGTFKGKPRAAALEAAQTMTDKSVHDFASTKHKGLPLRAKKKGNAVKKMIGSW